MPITNFIRFDRQSVSEPMCLRSAALWLAALVAVAFVSRIVSVAVYSPAGLFGALGSTSAIVIIAWYVVFANLHSTRSDLPLRSHGQAFAFIAALLGIASSALPTTSGAGMHWVLGTAVGTYLLIVGRNDRGLFAAGTVLLALSVNGLWGPVFFRLFSGELLRADAALVGWLLTWRYPEVRWDDTLITLGGQHGIVVVAQCSSFHNISLAVLCCVSLVMLERKQWIKHDIATLALVIIAIVLLNTSRIYVMALNRELYEYWHNGYGSQIFAALSTVVILLISYRGARRSA